MKYALTCLLFLSGYITNAQTCTGGLGLMDWEDDAIKEGFAKFMGKYYPDKDLPEILETIGKYMKKGS